MSDGCILRILDLLLSLDGERLSYRTLDVEQIGSVYETVMGFTVETRPGPALAIRAGKNDRTPVFVDVAALTAKKGSERAKFLKEEADRRLSDRQGRQAAGSGDGSGRGRSRRYVRSSTSAPHQAAMSRRLARRFCSRPMSVGAPAVTTRRVR